jgi:hypothetical protein
MGKELSDVEFWAKVKRAARENPDLPESFIAESLMSMAEPREKSTVFRAKTTATPSNDDNRRQTSNE